MDSLVNPLGGFSFRTWGGGDPQSPSMPSVLLPVRPGLPWLQVLCAILGGPRAVQPPGLPALLEFPGLSALAAPAAVHYLGTEIRI